MLNATITSAETIKTYEDGLLDLCIEVLDHANNNIFDFVTTMCVKHGRESFTGKFLASLAEYCYGVAERALFAEMDKDEPDEEVIEFMSGAMHFLD